MGIQKSASHNHRAIIGSEGHAANLQMVDIGTGEVS